MGQGKHSRDKSGIYETDKVNSEEYGKEIILGLNKKPMGNYKDGIWRKAKIFLESLPTLVQEKYYNEN